MRLDQFYLSLTQKQRMDFAVVSGTTTEYLEKFVFSQNVKYKRTPKPAMITKMVIACADACSAVDVMEFFYPAAFSVSVESSNKKDRRKVRGDAEKPITGATDQCSTPKRNGTDNKRHASSSSATRTRDQSQTSDEVKYEL